MPLRKLLQMMMQINGIGGRKRNIPVAPKARKGTERVRLRLWRMARECRMRDGMGGTYCSALQLQSCQHRTRLCVLFRELFPYQYLTRRPLALQQKTEIIRTAIYPLPPNSSSGNTLEIPKPASPHPPSSPPHPQRCPKAVYAGPSVPQRPPTSHPS